MHPQNHHPGPAKLLGRHSDQPGKNPRSHSGLKEEGIEPRHRRGKLRALQSGARVRPKPGAQESGLATIGVGTVVSRPSLRTARALLRHTALQLEVSSSGAARVLVGCV